MSEWIPQSYLNVFIAFLRCAAPILVMLLLFRCFRPLLSFRKQPEIWAWLILSDGKKIPITHWENIIGRHKRSDVVIDFPTVSRHLFLDMCNTYCPPLHSFFMGGAAPGVIGSEPRRKRRGDDDDDEYNSGISR